MEDGQVGKWLEVKTFVRIDYNNEKHLELQKQSEKKVGVGEMTKI